MRVVAEWGFEPGVSLPLVQHSHNHDHTSKGPLKPYENAYVNTNSRSSNYDFLPSPPPWHFPQAAICVTSEQPCEEGLG